MDTQSTLAFVLELKAFSLNVLSSALMTLHVVIMWEVDEEGSFNSMYAVTTIQSRNQRYRMQCQKQRFLSSKLYAKFNEENRKRTEKSSPNASFRTQNQLCEEIVKNDNSEVSQIWCGWSSHNLSYDLYSRPKQISLIESS